METGHGLVCLLQSCGLAFTGSLLKPLDGTLCSDNPSKTDSLKGTATYLLYIFISSITFFPHIFSLNISGYYEG